MPRTKWFFASDGMTFWVAVILLFILELSFVSYGLAVSCAVAGRLEFHISITLSVDIYP